MRKSFTETEMAYLQQLSAVENVTPTRIIYSESFKRHFLREYHAGRKPTEIFREAGLPVLVVGRKRIERCTYRWLRTYASGDNHDADTPAKRSRFQSKQSEDRSERVALLKETGNLISALSMALRSADHILTILKSSEHGVPEDSAYTQNDSKESRIAQETETIRRDTSD